MGNPENKKNWSSWIWLKNWKGVTFKP
jgi:hypothetical protein